MATVSIAFAIACSLTSLDGLSGGAAPDEAGAEAGPRDAALDTSLDAPTGSDASADAASFCASAPAGAFCDDFENGLSKWEVDTSNGNTFIIDDKSSVSSSHSATPMKSSGSTCLRRGFPGSPQTIEVDADVRFDAVASSGNYDFLGLRGSDNHNLTLQVQGGLIELDQDIPVAVDGGPDEQITPTGYGVDSAWHHIRWTNHLTGSTADVEVFVDGTKIGGMVVNVLDFASPLSLQVGDCDSLSGSPWQVRFDNVVVVTK